MVVAPCEIFFVKLFSCSSVFESFLFFLSNHLFMSLLSISFVAPNQQFVLSVDKLVASKRED